MWQGATHPPAEKPKSQIFSRLLAPLFSQALAAPVGGPLARSTALISIASPASTKQQRGRKRRMRRKMWRRAKQSSLTYDGARPCPKPLSTGTMHFAGPAKNARLAESLDEPPTSPHLSSASAAGQPGHPACHWPPWSGQPAPVSRLSFQRYPGQGHPLVTRESH